jgi:hypothetical protein
MFENILEFLLSKIYLQQNCVIECYNNDDGGGGGGGGGSSTPALCFLTSWIQNLA